MISRRAGSASSKRKARKAGRSPAPAKEKPTRKPQRDESNAGMNPLDVGITRGITLPGGFFGFGKETRKK